MGFHRKYISGYIIQAILIELVNRLQCKEWFLSLSLILRDWEGEKDVKKEGTMFISFLTLHIPTSTKHMLDFFPLFQYFE